SLDGYNGWPCISHVSWKLSHRRLFRTLCGIACTLIVLSYKKVTVTAEKTMRKLLVAGNWKMNLTTHEASLLVHRLNERIPIHQHLEVALAPSMLYLQPLSLQIDRRKF